MRGKRAPKRKVTPDPRFGSELVAKFVNNLMRDGKKSLAYRIFYQALERVEQKTGQHGLEVFHAALQNVMPVVEVRSRRIGGATFQIPTEVRPERRVSLGMKWIIRAARERHERTMVERLANELVAASKGEGEAVKKKENTHKMAEANKAFSHFKL
jgi:small subunit ribosomal protein S7